MFEINEKSTHREIVLYISSLPRYEIVAIGVFLNNNCDGDIPLYGAKQKMVRAIMEIDKEDLLDALEVIHQTDDCDEEPSDDTETSDDEDDNDSDEEEDDDDSEE